MSTKRNTRHSLAGALPILVAAAVASSTATSSAIITLQLNGTNGSNVITYTVSGSIVALFPVAATSSGFGQYVQNRPADAVWDAGVDNTLGDVFVDGSFTSTQNDDLVLSSVITLFKNGVPFGNWDTIDLDPTDGVSDDVEFDPTSNVSYPDMLADDIFSASGTGTFTLETGTYDTVFNEGVYQGTIDFGGGPEPTPFRVIVGIPEPSGIFLLGLGGGLFLIRRRR